MFVFSRRISEERLPGVIFLVTGVCLLVLGAIRLVFSHWMEYGCGIWTGSLVSRHNSHNNIQIYLNFHPLEVVSRYRDPQNFKWVKTI